MASKIITKGLKRTALSIALGMCFASSVVLAQSSVGTVFGTAKPGSSVTIVNTGTGATRDVTADSTGRFNFAQLAPGSYTVSADGVTRNISVRVGTGSEANLTGTTTLGAVTVSGANVNTIDVSSVESTTVFTAEQLNKIPVARDVTSVALLAPGTVKGDTGFGNLASFGGASVAENGYYINGFDVTNLRTLLSFATVPFEGIAEQQVKTGGYGAEYGRSLGGVISLVTKRGTNEWKGGVSVSWNPKWLRESGKNVVSRDPGDLASGSVYSAYRSDNDADLMSYVGYASGPIIKDRLFFFALVEGVNNEQNGYAQETSRRDEDTTPHFLAKIDWNITDNHIVELTALRNTDKTKVTQYRYANGAYYVGRHEDVFAEQTVEDGGDMYIGKYTGYLTDNFTISAQYGKLENTINYITPENLPGSECVRAYDSQANRFDVLYTGCFNQANLFIRDPDFGPNIDTREAYRIDGEWRIGDHNLRFGYDLEDYESGSAGTTYTGGAYWRHFYVYEPGGRRVNGIVQPFGTYYARRWIRGTESGSFTVENKATYLEDNWQVTDNLMLYLGVRQESFSNANSDGDTFVAAKNQIAPRLGFSWDVNGDSTFKVFGNAGRYYIPVTSNTNIRLSGVEFFNEDFYRTTGFDPATGLPTGLGAQIGPLNINGSESAPDPRTVAATNLSPMYQDEYIAGFQLNLGNNWTAGLRAVYRDVKAGMDDFCSVQPFQDWADDNGYDNFDYHSLASCFLLNPGRDTGIALDLEDDGNLTDVIIPASYFGMPAYQRSYKAIEIFWEKATADWSLQGSYTWSKSYGNIEGYVNSSLEQPDAGATQDFDNKIFEDGAYGYLPNDRRHVVKLFGSYSLTDEWRVGGNLAIASGRPVSCFGYGPLGADLDSGGLAPYGPGSFYCVDPESDPADPVQVLGQRGDYGRTPWTYNLDVSLAYTPTWADGKLQLKMAVFNVLNLDQVTEYNENGDLGGASSPAADLNFLNDQNYQTPRSVQLTARYEF